MVSSAKKIILVVEKWSDAMALHLATIKADCSVEWYENEVKAGELVGFGVYHEGLRVGTVLTRIDDDEYVFVAGAGRADFDLIDAVVPQLEQLAIAASCSSVRLHTRRRGMLEKAKKQGFYPSEIVMRKAVRHGR